MVGVIGTIIIAAVIIAVVVAVTAGMAGGVLAGPDEGSVFKKDLNEESLKVIYGLKKIKRPQPVFMEVDGRKNKYLHIVYALAEGEIEAVTQIFIRDILTWEDGAFLSDAEYDGEKNPYTDNIEFYIHSGTDAQEADTDLVDRVDSWTTSHKLSGVAYIYVRLEFKSSIFFSGVPKLDFVIKGKKVYDPRDGTTAWSDNPALCIRDFLTNGRYGRDIPVTDIDDTSLIGVANYCDEQITLNGTTQKRYLCNGIVDPEDKTISIIKDLVTSCRGWLIFSAGKYILITDKIEVPTYTFSEDNIIGKWTISLGNKSNIFNRVKANFPNKARFWKNDFAVVESTDLRDDDAGRLLEKTIHLPFTTSLDRATYIATQYLNQSRQHLAVSFTATIDALNAVVGDVVYISHATPGWDQLNSGLGKKFRIMKMLIEDDGDIKVTAKEYDPTVFNPVINVDDHTPNVGLPDMNDVAVPVNLEVTEELYVTLNGKGAQTRAILTWDDPNDAFVTSYIVEYATNSIDSNGVFVHFAETRTRRVEINDLPLGTHDFRVRSVNQVGVMSSFSTVSSTLVGLTAKPNNILGLSVRALDGNAYLAWSASEDLDVIHGGYIRFRHSSVTTNAVWNDGVDIGQKIGGNVTDTVLPLISGTYLAKAVDSTGQFSQTAAVAITTVRNVNLFNAVAELDETATTPKFSGQKDDMVVSGVTLRLDGAPFFIFQENGFKILTETGDELEREVADTGTVESSGVYNFSSNVKLASVVTSRVSSEFSTSASLIADTIDSRINDINEWNDFDDLNGISGDKVSAEIQVRYTEDDPDAASPAWSVWQKLLVGDFKARGFEFRVIAESTDSEYNIDISKLKVFVDMPDRVDRGQDLSADESGYSVTYNPPFLATPTVGISANALGSSSHFIVTASTNLGFTVTFYDASDAAKAANFNYQSIGY